MIALEPLPAKVCGCVTEFLNPTDLGTMFMTNKSNLKQLLPHRRMFGNLNVQFTGVDLMHGKSGTPVKCIQTPIKNLGCTNPWPESNSPMTPQSLAFSQQHSPLSLSAPVSPIHRLRQISLAAYDGSIQSDNLTSQQLNSPLLATFDLNLNQQKPAFARNNSHSSMSPEEYLKYTVRLLHRRRREERRNRCASVLWWCLAPATTAGTTSCLLLTFVLLMSLRLDAIMSTESWVVFLPLFLATSHAAAVSISHLCFRWSPTAAYTLICAISTGATSVKYTFTFFADTMEPAW